MQTIVWDVDDVLNNLMEAWLDGWRVDHPAAPAYVRLTSNPPHETLGIGLDDYLKSLDHIRNSVAEHDRLTARPEILAWLKEHGARFRHVALTARPPHTAGPAAAWTLHHFGAWIRTVAFVPVRPPPSWPVYDLSKADYLHWLDADAILIDDSLANVAGARKEGLRALLFPQPWNDAEPSVASLLDQLTALSA